MSSNNSTEFSFLRKRHVAFLRRSLSVLPPSTVTYDTSRMTILFFALSGLDILDALEEVPKNEIEEIIEWIHSLQLLPEDGYQYGGFRGGHCFTGIDKIPESNNHSSLEPSHSSIIHTSTIDNNTLNNSNSNSHYTKKSFNAKDNIINPSLNDHNIPEKLRKLLDATEKSCKNNFCASSQQALKNSVDNAPARSGNKENALNFDTGHLTMTYTALAALLLLGDDLSQVNKAAVLKHVASLQLDDGSFQSNLGGSENDLRFVYCAAAVCHMLGDTTAIDTAAAARYIRDCLGYGGALGQGALQESHGGSTYCGVAALHLLGALYPPQDFSASQSDKVTTDPATTQPSSPNENNSLSEIQLDALIRFLVMRQENVRLVDAFGKPSLGGGLQGRPNKPGDTCYTFWIGATLKLLGCADMVSSEPLQQFVLATQDSVRGGFGKGIGTGSDALHTYLGLSGLAVLGLLPELKDVDPALNITVRAKQHLQTLQMHLRR